ncbi:MAG: hypothetical protein K2G93_03995 [Rikenella sp.]|nr:hypothetical protein [Rikenella sp.]
MKDEADRVKEKIARLKRYGVDEIDMVNGVATVREKFMDVARLLKEGDELVVCSLSDICTRVDGLLEILLICTRKRFLLRSLDERWLEDCLEVLRKKEVERFVSHLCRFAPLLVEQTTETTDLKPADETVQGGRPKGSIKMSSEKLDLAVRMYCQGDFTVRDICDIVRCNERSMYRYLKLRGVGGLRKMSGTAGVDNRNNAKSNHSVAPEN